MPAPTNNTNILDGVNNLISALNELVSVTQAQTMSPVVNVTNDVPVPSVTVEASPIPPAPDVTVNFDTASIANNLITVADRIAADGTNLGARMDTANGHFVNIADRLAPQDKNIYDALILIQHALETSATAQIEALADEIPDETATTTTTYAPPNAVKCEAARRVIGMRVKLYDYWRRNLLAGKALVTGHVGLAALMTGGGSSAAVIWGASQVAFLTAVEMIFGWGQQDVDTFYNEYKAIAEDLVCAMYAAPDSTTAIADYQNIINSATWTHPDAAELNLIMLPINSVNKMFASPEKLGPAYQGRQEMGDWTEFDCSTCPTLWTDNVNSGGPYSGGTWHPDQLLDPVTGWIYDTQITVTGEPGATVALYGYLVELWFSVPTVVTLNELGDGQILDYLEAYDYGNNLIDQRVDLTNPDLSYTTPPCYKFVLSSRDRLTNYVATITIHDPGV